MDSSISLMYHSTSSLSEESAQIQQESAPCSNGRRTREDCQVLSHGCSTEIQVQTLLSGDIWWVGKECQRHLSSDPSICQRSHDDVAISADSGADKRSCSHCSPERKCNGDVSSIQ